MRFQRIIKGLSRIALYLLIFVTMSSCGDDMFNARIGDKVLPDQHFNNANDVWSSFNGIVLLLQEIMPNHILVDGLLSDQMQPTGGANAELVNLYNHTFSSGNALINGAPYYKVIISANDILSNIDNVVGKDLINYDSITNLTVRRALITYRSWAYLNYVRLYGSATIIPERLVSIDDAANMEVVDKENMLYRLIDDLTPVLHDISSSQAEIFIKNAINTRALLGEIYLELNNYEMAEKYLREACDSFGRIFYKVDRVYSRDNYASIFRNPDGAEREVMVSVPFSFEDGQKNPLETFFSPDFDFMLEPTTNIVNAFGNQERLNDTIPGDNFRGMGVAIDSVPGSDSRFYISKYALESVAVPFSADIIIYRAGDIHLMLAEAYNRLGQSDIALTIMNEGIRQLSPRPADLRTWASNEGIRGRVFLRPRVVPDDVTDRVAYVEDLIMEERALELAFEGRRWFDLMRVARRRNDPAYLANMVASKYADPASTERVRQRLMIQENWYLPAF